MKNNKNDLEEITVDNTGKKVADFVEGIINSQTIDFVKELLNDLKGPMKRVAIVFILFLIIGTLFSVPLVEAIKSVVPSEITLVAFSPAEVFFSVIMMVIAFAAVCTFPFALFEGIKFAMPALYANERKIATRLIPISFILFVIGAIFGLVIMTVFGLSFLAEFGTTYGITNLWSLGGLINTLTFIGIGFGIAFQLPVIVILLVQNKFITTNQLKKYRPHIIVALLVISAFLTPPDIVSQILMTAPLYLLFEGSLIYLKVFNKNEK